MKTKKNIYVFVILLLLVYWTTAFRAFPQEEPIYLSIDDCMNKGLEKSQAIHAALMQNKEARARLYETNTNYLPLISTSFSYSRLSETDPYSITFPLPGNPVTQEIVSPIMNSYSFNLSVKQPIFTGFRIMNTAGKASGALDASIAYYNKTKNETVYSIKIDYWQLIKAVEVKKVIDENLRVVNAYLNDVMNLFKQGLATNNDVLKSQVQLSNAEIKQMEAENHVELARLKLSISMGMETPILILPIVPEYRSNQLPENPETFFANALKVRHELSALHAQIKASRKDVEIANSSWYPTIYLTGNLAYAQPNQRYFPPVEEFQLSWDIGVYASIDASAWYRTPFKTEQAAARLSALQDSEIQLHQSINMEVMQAWLNANTLSRKVDAARIILNQAEENKKIVTRNFENGIAVNSEFLEAQLQNNQAALELTISKIDFEIAVINLQKAAGYDPYENPSVASYENPSVASYENPSVASYENPSVASYENPSEDRDNE